MTNPRVYIGAELGYIEGAIELLNIEMSPYSIFLNSMKYAHYPILTIIFMFILIWMKKDFGAMFSAEKKARAISAKLNSERVKSDESLKTFDPKAEIGHRWYNAAIPIFVLLGTVIAGLAVTGYDAEMLAEHKGVFKKIQAIVGNADSYVALLWGSLASVIVAVLMSTAGKLLTLQESMESLMNGIKTMLPAILILVMAWSLANITEVLHTADFLISIVPDFLGPYWLPLIVFILSAVVSFATGSSWGTMAILYPLCLPLAFVHSQNSGLSIAETMPVLFNVTSVVLAGSVFGDHCSPISDTTILSSLASSCDHIAHVRTQLPYALTVGGFSILTGGILFAAGSPWWLNFVIGLAGVFLAVKFLGKTVEEDKTVSK